VEQVDVRKLLERFKIEARLDGDELHALCPSHQDTKPSWSINVRTGKHFCFACGFGGTAASLVIHALDVGNLGWNGRDACEWIKSQGLTKGGGEQGFEVELYLQPGKGARFVLPRAVQLVTDVPFAEWPSGARRYLESRSVDAWQAEEWNLGFSIVGRLAGRVVFPVRDRRGRPQSYSARSFVGSAVRYLTPDASENPSKTSLFGEEKWEAGRRVVVVEGALKALAVKRARPDLNVAGVLGATQARNATVIGKLAAFPEVTIMLDNDEAGQRAAGELFAGLCRHTKASNVLPAVPVDDAAVEDLRGALAG